MQMFDRVLNTRESDAIGNLSRSSYDEYLAKPLVESELRWNARIATRQNDSFRLLSPDEGTPPCMVLTGVSGMTGNKPLISLDELLEGEKAGRLSMRGR